MAARKVIDGRPLELRPERTVANSRPLRIIATELMVCSSELLLGEERPELYQTNPALLNGEQVWGILSAIAD